MVLWGSGLRHQVVGTGLSLWATCTPWKSTYCMVLWAGIGWKLRIPWVLLSDLLLLHHVIQLVVLVVLFNEGLLLVALVMMQLLLTHIWATHSNRGSTRLIVVAQIDFHMLLLLLGCQLRIPVGRNCENVDLLIEIGILIEVIIESTISALAALVWLLSIMPRLIQVVVVNIARAGIDDLAARPSHTIHHTSRLRPHGSSIVIARTKILVPSLSLINIRCLKLLLDWCTSSLHHLIRSLVQTSLFQAWGSFICFQVYLLVLGLRDSFIQ